MTREEIKQKAAAYRGTRHRAQCVGDDIENAFVEGAEWMQEQYENNRLSHCDNMTEQEAQKEMEFVTSFIKQNDRIPTFSDCIENTRKEMIDKTFKWLIRRYGDMAVATQYFNSMREE